MKEPLVLVAVANLEVMYEIDVVLESKVSEIPDTKAEKIRCVRIDNLVENCIFRQNIAETGKDNVNVLPDLDI